MGKVSSSTKEYQFFAVKLQSSEEITPTRVTSCSIDGIVATKTIQADSCLIDNVCYVAGATSEIFGRPCLVCNPDKSQTAWSYGPTVGVQDCFIDNVCYEDGELYEFRKSLRETFTSQCQSCSPTVDKLNWPVDPSFLLMRNAEPPNDCLNITAAPEVKTDTYQNTCKLPEFEWAAYGTHLTGRMYTRRAALLGDSLYAAGYLKSTNAPNKEGFVDVTDDFGVTGTYTTADQTGASAFTITSDLISYTTEFGSFAQYEVGIVKINRITGKPEDVLVYYGVGSGLVD